jgi:hypothetical protein
VRIASLTGKEPALRITAKGALGMPRLPRYCEIIARFRSRIDDYMTASYGKRDYSRLRNTFLRGLLETLMTGQRPQEEIPDRKLAAMLKQAELQSTQDDHRLAKAWYERRVYKSGRGAVASRWRVRPAEIRYLEQLWADLRYTQEEYRALIEDAGADWTFVVDEMHEEIVVWLDEKAIEDIVLVALEAYAVPRRGVAFTETYGICFGSTKTTEEKRVAHGKHITRHIDVDSVHIQLRAECYSNKVTYDLRSLETQMEVAKILFPQLDIVGDFHTHVYRTVQELRESRGWSFSGADEAVIPTWADPLREKGYHPRASLIVGVATGGKRITRPGRMRHNVIRFSVNKYHFYVACFRIIGDRYSDTNITLQPIAIPGT